MVARKLSNVLSVSVISRTPTSPKACTNKILGLALCCAAFRSFSLPSPSTITPLSSRSATRSSCNSFGNSLPGNDFDLEMRMRVLRSLPRMVSTVSVTLARYVSNIPHGTSTYVI